MEIQKTPLGQRGLSSAFQNNNRVLQGNGIKIPFKPSVEGFEAMRFAGQKPSVLSLTPVQTQFLQQLHTMLAPYDVHQVQAWDETKTPPLPVLKTFTEKGIFVSGVPIPPMENAANLLNDDTLQQAMGPENLKRALDLLANTAQRKQSEAFLNALGKDGFNKAMTLASMTLPKMTSVGVSTFLGVNNGLSAQSVLRIGTPEQQALWLNALNHGVFTYAFGLTEDKIGSDPRSIQTTFRKFTGEDGKPYYKLNGNKKFIGNAAQVVDKNGHVIHRGADFIIVYAVDDPDKAPADKSFRAFMVPRNAIGEENIHHTGNNHNKMGLREVNNGDFTLKDVVVPESLLLGKPDEDIYKKLLGLLDITRLFVGSMGLGTTEGALESAKAYAAQRVQNGNIIQHFQMVGFPLKELEAKAAAAKLLVMEAARMVDDADQKTTKGEQPERFGLETAMAKLFCTELAEDATKQAANTLGGRGFLEDPDEGLGIPKRARDAKVLTIYEGTSNIQRNVIAQSVMMSELKRVGSFKNPNDMRRALRFFLFRSYITRYTHYPLLMLTSFTPVDRVNATYQKALVDVVTAYEASQKKVAKEWALHGPPPEYALWDKKSRDRQLNLEASLPVQYRLGILADIAVYRKLLHLSLKELALLDQKPSLSPDEKALQTHLRLFEQIAEETVMEKAKQLENRSLEMMEHEYQNPAKD